MLKWLKRYKKPEAVKEMADLLARLAWLETQEATLDFIGPYVYARVYSIGPSGLRNRLAEGVGDNMLEAINDVMEILRKQEALNGKS